jgi:hypothetical protein
MKFYWNVSGHKGGSGLTIDVDVDITVPSSNIKITFGILNLDEL